LEQARLVAALRRIGVPLTEIKVIGGGVAHQPGLQMSTA